MAQILGSIASLFAIVSGIYFFYKKVIEPKRNRTKLKELLQMIEKWFDLLDINLENDLNLAGLNNQERKIHEYIENELAHYLIKPKKKTIRNWNKKMGIKKELRDSFEIFQRFSRTPSNEIFLDMFFTMIVANFYKFHSAYNSNNNKQQVNFADIEMPVKFFKFYVKSL